MQLHKALCWEGLGFDIALLKFLMIFEEAALHFHFSVGPANNAPGSI